MNYKDYYSWYYRLDVQYKLAEYAKNRESAFMTPKGFYDHGFNTRMLRIHSPQHFQFFYLNCMRWQQNQHIYNVYCSVAQYRDGIPRLDHHHIFDKGRDYSDWIKAHFKEMDAYDFVLDIDAPEFKHIDVAHDDTRRIIDLFCSLSVPFQVRFSGMGFHIIIPSEYFYDLNLSYDPENLRSRYRLFSGLAQALSKEITELIDLTIYDSRRLLKVPYSLAVYHEGLYVCCPFESIREFNLFELESMQISYFNGLRDRMDPIFNKNGNINKLLKKYDISADDLW